MSLHSRKEKVHGPNATNDHVAGQIKEGQHPRSSWLADLVTDSA